MNIHDLATRPSPSQRTRDDASPVVSSRIRLARNLRDHPFPGRAGEAERTAVWENLRDHLLDLSECAPALALALDGVRDLDRMILFERHLISREQAEGRAGSGLVLRTDEQVALMVNEEDHLRMQALRPGLDLAGAWQDLDAVDSALEARVRFAFSARLGYLTACPTNVGTGMRASVMLHLPGLALIGEVGPIINGLGKIGLAVRGLWGEGTEATGHLYQISNQITLGVRETEVLDRLEAIVREVVEHEINARQRLTDSQPSVVEDRAGRAWGILTRARILPSQEALDLLSALRLGLDLGILPQVSRKAVDELMVLTQPAHLQVRFQAVLSPRERDERRADLVRQRLQETSEPSPPRKDAR